MKIFLVALALAGIVGCSNDDAPTHTSSEMTQTIKDRLDADAIKSLASCDSGKMTAQGVGGISWADSSHVCQVIASSLGRQPTIGLLRNMAKAVFAFNASGLKDDPKDIIYQLMNISESRNNKTDDEIFNTANTVFKCFNGSQGHVTPRDINVNLRTSGDLAKTMSDQGIFGMCAMIQESKKSRGE